MTMNMNRYDLAHYIVQRLQDNKERLHKEFFTPEQIKSCLLDDVFPADIAGAIYPALPAQEELILKKTLREFKYIGVQMNHYNPLLEEVLYAFQDVRVVMLLKEITGIQYLFPDENLYAGGVSMMVKGQYITPHLDNSHNRDRTLYRALNLLYYVTPDWKEDYGGNLELWDKGLRQKNRVINSQFNRLVMMSTNRSSWHSVNPITVDGRRCCISNYYFSPVVLDAPDYFHVTSFRGRPGQPITDIALQADTLLRNKIRKVFPKGIVKNPHMYKRNPAK